MKAIDYRQATDRLVAPPHSFHLRLLAERLGVSLNTVKRARMTGDHSRPAPKGWQAAAAELAFEHAEELKRKAADLYRLARELKAQ